MKQTFLAALPFLLFGCDNVVVVDAPANTPACTTDDDCEEGTACLEEACVTTCVSDEDCQAPTICKDAVCLPECATDSDCLEGFECVASACTVAGACDEDIDCEGTQRCVDGSCEAECVADTDCEDGDCVEGTCENQCASNDDCEEGLVCSEGICTDGCTDDAQCPDGRTCGDDGLCVLSCPFDSCPGLDSTCEDGQLITFEGEAQITDECQCDYSAVVRTVETCPSGEACSDGRCQNECEDELSEDLPCGTDVVLCRDDLTALVSSSVCNDGACVPASEVAIITCEEGAACFADLGCASPCVEDECAVPDSVCNEGGQVQSFNSMCVNGACVETTDGTTDCGATEVCDAGVCGSCAGNCPLTVCNEDETATLTYAEVLSCADDGLGGFFCDYTDTPTETACPQGCAAGACIE